MKARELGSTLCMRGLPCGGSGIGALRLARTAKSAATADITRRSAVFADFNAQFHGTYLFSGTKATTAPFNNAGGAV